MASIIDVLRHRGMFHPNKCTFFIAWALISIAILFNLILLCPEVLGVPVIHGDAGFHLLLAESVTETLKYGGNLTDPWQDTMGMGYPVLHHYQHLPHIVLALLHTITFESIPLIDLLRWTNYLLLSFFPLSVYWAMRRFGFDPLPAAMSGLVASLVGNDFQYYGGLGYRNYTYEGWSLYAQLWGMIFLPVALAVSYRTLTEGRGYLWSIVLLSATLMSHLVFGYIAFITLGALTFTNISRDVSVIWIRWRRLAIVFLLVTIVASYFLIPFFIDREFFNASVLSKDTVQHSFGHWVVIKALVTGDLFDLGRIPILTALVFSGLIICFVNYRAENYRILLAIFALWVLLFFGRTTWDNLLNLLPLSESVHMIRFVAGVHLGGILLAGVALAAPWGWAWLKARPYSMAVCFLVTILLLLPVYIERVSYYRQNASVIQLNQTALDNESSDLSNLYKTLRTMPPGRVFVESDGIGFRGQYAIGNNPVYVFLLKAGFDVASYTYHRYSWPGILVTRFDEISWEQYDLFNVRYVVAPGQWEAPDFTTLVGKFGSHYLYVVETSGYFDLVGTGAEFTVRQKDYLEAASIWMNSNLLMVKRYPELQIIQSTENGSSPGPNSIVGYKPSTLSNTVESLSEISSGPNRGRIVSERHNHLDFIAEVQVERPSMILLKTSYHPNWRATVDGMDRPTAMLMPGFIGVYLEPGSHSVVMKYRARALRPALMYIGFITLIAIGLWNTRKVRDLSRKVLFNASKSMKRRL